MKKTLNVNIGSMAFIIDEDAYWVLKRYLDDVESRFEVPEREEAMSDIEMRIADIFTENLSVPLQVVDMALVRKVIAIMGKAEMFGEQKTFDTPPSYNRERKLTRSRDDKVIAGVCGGIARYFGLDVTLVRVVTFLLIFFGGVSLWVYIILWIVLPEATGKNMIDY